jgi:membrane-associated phospholipid phosphatase
MIKRNASGQLAIILTIIVWAVIFICIKYLDTEIAIRIMRFIRSIRTIHKATENIPDLLPYLVGIGTVLMWIIYLYRTHEKRIDVKTKFLQLAGVTLPVAYLIKTFLQFAFGRTNTRLWLTANKPLLFNWFHGIGFGCFPSGHMTAFTAFGTAVLFYFPQYRKPVLIILTFLGAALIATDYHFLSDVIAGAYLGFITTYFLWNIFEKWRVSLWVKK